MEELIKSIREQEQAIDAERSDPDTARKPGKLAELGRRKAELSGILDQAQALESVECSMRENAEIMKESDDPELKTLAMEENIGLSVRRDMIEKELKRLLLPRDPSDDKDVIIEIRAGAGGDESSLFAAELFRMYSHYAETIGWTLAVIHANRTEVGGYKEIVFELNQGRAATAVYRKLKYESGVHHLLGDSF